MPPSVDVEGGRSKKIFMANEGALLVNVVAVSDDNVESYSLDQIRSWTVDQVAAWVKANGGGSSGAARVQAEEIDGLVLISQSVDDLVNVISADTFGGKVRLQTALNSLIERVGPPGYASP
ncbi:hypothetical protein HDU82_008082 [Entophlyctis luteolus]|nr:hypothetical protein HDU82_008082 [Entophlyctis luteolus]